MNLSHLFPPPVVLVVYNTVLKLNCLEKNP